MFNTKKSLILILIFSFAINGCVMITKYDAIMTLKRFGASQAEIQQYLDKQEKLFDKLVEDIKDDKLEKGTSQRRIIALYGDPIFFKEVKDKPGITEVLLYRHPTEYFSSDKVYLYFDNNENLAFWEYKPFQKNSAK